MFLIHWIELNNNDVNIQIRQKIFIQCYCIFIPHLMLCSWISINFRVIWTIPFQLWARLWKQQKEKQDDRARTFLSTRLYLFIFKSTLCIHWTTLQYKMKGNEMNWNCFDWNKPKNWNRNDTTLLLSENLFIISLTKNFRIIRSNHFWHRFLLLEKINK